MVRFLDKALDRIGVEIEILGLSLSWTFHWIIQSDLSYLWAIERRILLLKRSR